MRKIFITLLLVISASAAFAQNASITGTVITAHEKEKLRYSNVLLIRKADSVIVQTARADESGSFQLSRLKKGYYTLIISYPKMADYVKDLLISDAKIESGDIEMDLKSNLLEEVHIIAAKKAISRKGDTTVYQADSFKVAEHANVGELLRRLPGIEVDINGRIRTQGQDVKKVLVDGDEFFGDDPLMVMKYLKAKGVSEVQVYDKKSKEADFTGIDDGVREKTINVKLKENAKNGYISDVDLKSSLFKYNDDGALAGVYVRKLKAAVFGQKTNLNLNSYAGNSFSGFTSFDNYYQINSADEGIPGAGSNIYNNVDNSGLPDNLKLSSYFSDKWAKNNVGTLSTNYFDNRSTNYRTSRSEELLPNGSVFKTLNANSNESRNSGYDIKAAVTLELDSSSTLKIDFRAKQNHGENSAVIDNESFGNENQALSKNTQTNSGFGNADLFNGNINYSKKFHKKGRSLTIDLQPQNKKGSGIQSNLNNTAYYDNDGNFLKKNILNLRKEDKGTESSLGGRISFTEPLMQGFSLQAAYSFKVAGSTSDKETFDNSGAGQAGKRIDSLSNNFRYNSVNNIGRAVLQYKSGNLTASSGLELTQTGFELEDVDTKKTFERHYLNFAPNTDITLQTFSGTNVSFRYDGKTVQPTISQLQPVREIDNPLYEVVGNPGLKPAFRNNFTMSFRKGAPQSASAYVTLYYTFTKNAIINAESVDQYNKRTTTFLNVNGTNTLGTSLNYDFRFSGTGLTGNTSVNYTLNHRVAVLNGVRNDLTNNSYSFRGGLRYSTKKMYFSTNSYLSMNEGSSSLGSLNNGRTFNHNHQLAANMKLPLKIEFNATASLNFQPANESFAKPFNTYQLNGYVSKKLLKNESLEVKVSANDILNQQTGYTRTVSGNSTTELTYSYIPRFFLIGLRLNMSGNFITKEKNK